MHFLGRELAQRLQELRGAVEDFCIHGRKSLELRLWILRCDSLYYASQESPCLPASHWATYLGGVRLAFCPSSPGALPALALLSF